MTEAKTPLGGRGRHGMNAAGDGHVQEPRQAVYRQRLLSGLTVRQAAIALWSQGRRSTEKSSNQPKYAQQGGCWKSGSPERVRRSVVSNFATPRTVARQAPLSMKFSSQECWSGLPFPAPGDLPNSGIEPGSPVLQADSLPCKPPGKPQDPLSQRHVLLLQEMRLIHGEAKEQSRGHTEREREKRDDWETKDWDFSVFLGGLGPGLPTRD